ncbi:MAG: phage tail protein [Chloroflexi bacterium]|nr:phage tail protein [Chloroflexota bacterium]
MRFRLRIDAPRFFVVVDLPARGKVVIGRWPQEFPRGDIEYYRLIRAADLQTSKIDYLRANRHQTDYFLFIDEAGLDASRQHILLECTDKACWVTDISKYGTRRSRLGAYMRVRLVRDERVPLAPDDQLEIPTELSADKLETIQALKIIFELRQQTVLPPPPFEPLPPLPLPAEAPDYEPSWLALLPRHSRRLIKYLPEIYQPPAVATHNNLQGESQLYDSAENFFVRYLALFESILLPIDWTIGNFDLFLHPKTAPQTFLPWLARWFGWVFDETWDEKQQRTLLAQAYAIYARCGTSWALGQLLQIYTGQIAEISEDFDKATFTVKLRAQEEQRTYIVALIDAHKPAHAAYQLILEAPATVRGL